MRKSKLLVLGIFIICSAFRKDQPDFRNGYIGNYLCTVRHVSITWGQKPVKITEKIILNVTVAEQDSAIKVTLGKSPFVFKMKQRALYTEKNAGHKIGEFFAQDSIRFNLPLGHSNVLYLGKKISN